MFKSYIILAFRNILKYRFYSFLNVFGLGGAIAFAILGYVNYDFSRSYDNFHENRDSIYRLKSKLTSNGVQTNWAIIPLAMPYAMQNDISGITAYTRIQSSSGAVRYGDRVFNETVYHSDYVFFSMFTFEFISGSGAEFNSPTSAVITREYAEKYFGSGDPVGRELVYESSSGETTGYTVVGVIENIPKNSSTPFDIMLPFEKWLDYYELEGDEWGTWTNTVLIQLEDGTSAVDVEKNLDRYLDIQNSALPERKVDEFYLESLRTMALTAEYTRGDNLMPGLPASAVAGPTIAGVMLLMIACFNFLHTAISTASNRMKEIGIRKVLGGIKRQLVIQFLTENVVLCVLALFVGLVMSNWLVAYYDSLWPYWEFKLKFSGNSDIFAFLAVLLIVTGISSGAYPAFYVTRFQPVSILKGSFKIEGKERVKKALFAGQFTLTVMTVLMGFVLERNSEYQRTVDLGFDREQIVGVHLTDSSQYPVLKESISSNPEISSISASASKIGRGYYYRSMEVGEVKADCAMMMVGENYLQTVGLDLVSGSWFDKDRPAESQSSLLVNQMFAEEYSLDPAIGSVVTIDSIEYIVIGVVNDFFHSGLWSEIRPFMLRYVPEDQYRYLVIRSETAAEGDMLKYLEETWKELFPENPFTGFYQDEVTAQARQVNESIRRTSILTSVLTILISSMGLYALISFAVLKRRKEIGIRKVLGAGNGIIAGLVSKDFLILLTISCVLGSIGGYIMIQSLLGAIFAHYAGYSMIPILMATSVLFAVAAFSAGYQVYKASTANPVESIRYE